MWLLCYIRIKRHNTFNALLYEATKNFPFGDIICGGCVDPGCVATATSIKTIANDEGSRYGSGLILFARLQRSRQNLATEFSAGLLFTLLLGFESSCVSLASLHSFVEGNLHTKPYLWYGTLTPTMNLSLTFQRNSYDSEDLLGSVDPRPIFRRLLTQ